MYDGEVSRPNGRTGLDGVAQIRVIAHTSAVEMEMGRISTGKAI